jgi:hypothetical protein
MLISATMFLEIKIIPVSERAASQEAYLKGGK